MPITKIDRSAYRSLWDNKREIAKLMSLEGLVKRICQRKKGSAYGVYEFTHVLRNCQIVLLVASWEAFVEDLAQQTFDLLRRARRTTIQPSQFKRAIEKFHNPTPENISKLFVGFLPRLAITTFWRWPGMSSEHAKKKLMELIHQRHLIAHRVGRDLRLRQLRLDDSFHFLGYLFSNMYSRLGTHLNSMGISNRWHGGYKRGGRLWKKRLN